jgi:hypothetical protein
MPGTFLGAYGGGDGVAGGTAGRKGEGLVIRRASRQIGQKMQEHSKSYIGNLVGRAVVSLAMSRAGGEEYQSNPHGTGASERWAKERQAHYADYLRSTSTRKKRPPSQRPRRTAEPCKHFYAREPQNILGV